VPRLARRQSDLKRLAVAAAVIAGTLVSAASATELTIVPGVGIGKVKLGMTAAQVKKALGKSYTINSTTNLSGRHYVEYGWNYSQWTVTFAQQGRRLRVVQVGVVTRKQRTAKGIGPGSSWRALVRAYPNGVCRFNPLPINAAAVKYLVPRKGGTHTIYVLPSPRPNMFNPGEQKKWQVSEVQVRTPWMPLPEFGRDWIALCSPDWRTSDSPL
jgi:hypothetical protein